MDMIKNMSIEEYIEQKKLEIVAIAQQILESNIGIIGGSRILFRLQSEVTEDSFDQDFMIFKIIESETDALPAGSERQYWAESSLNEKDKAIELYENQYRDQAFEGCRILINRCKNT